MEDMRRPQLHWCKTISQEKPRMVTKLAFAGCAAIALTLLAPHARAQATEGANARIASNHAEYAVPRLVQFNGVLKDGAGRLVSGAASVTFAIYSEQEGGAAIWSETQNVLADANGHYSAVLGAATSGGFPAELFGTGESRWLGVAVARQAEMPRALLASVPYALKAGDAQTLGGLPASSYVTTQQLAARGAIVAPSTTIVEAGGQPAANGASASENAPGVTGAATQSVTQASITGTGTSQYIPLWTSGSNLSVSNIFQTTNSKYIGINTNMPQVQLDVNGNARSKPEHDFHAQLVYRDFGLCDGPQQPNHKSRIRRYGSPHRSLASRRWFFVLAI
jgi:hypothetical protein